MFPHEVPSRLSALPSLGPVPLRSLPWLALALAVAVGVVLLDGPAAAALAGVLGWGRAGAIGFRLGLGVLAAAPFFALAAPGVILGHSIPSLVGAAGAWSARPRLTVWRPSAPCAPVAVAPRDGQPRRADTWGADREEW